MRRRTAPRRATCLLVVFGALIAHTSCGQEAPLFVAAPDLTFESEGMSVTVQAALRDATRDAAIDIRQLIERELAYIQPRLKAPPTNITYTIGPGIPEVGMGGGTHPTTGNVLFRVEISHRFGLPKILEHVGPALAHELNHAKRIREDAAFTSGLTLGRAFVFEGLGTASELELYPEGFAPWSTALTAAQEEEVWARAKPLLHSPITRVGLLPWLFGTGDLPRWAGYTIGYHIVRSYEERHRGTSAADLAAVDAEVILSESGYSGRA